MDTAEGVNVDEGTAVERGPEDPAPTARGPEAAAPVPVARRRRGTAFWLLVALVVLLVVGLIAILLGLLSRPGGVGSGPVSLSGPVDGRQTAVFELNDGATTLNLHAKSMGDDLYRVSVPRDSELAPHVDRNDGDVRLTLSSSGHSGPGVVDVDLNADVAWTVRINAGTRQSVIDMTGGKVDRVDLGGGAAQIELTLPQPSRVVPVQMTGGVDQFLVHLPAGTPVRMTFGSGAGRATLDGTTHQGIAPGQSFTANGWGQSNTGVDLQAQAGVGALTATTGP